VSVNPAEAVEINDCELAEVGIACEALGEMGGVAQGDPLGEMERTDRGRGEAR